MCRMSIVESCSCSLSQVLRSLTVSSEIGGHFMGRKLCEWSFKPKALLAACALRLYLHRPVANRPIPIERAGSPKKLTRLGRGLSIPDAQKATGFLLCVPDRHFWHVAQKRDSLANPSLKKGAEKSKRMPAGNAVKLQTSEDAWKNSWRADGERIMRGADAKK